MSNQVVSNVEESAPAENTKLYLWLHKRFTNKGTWDYYLTAMTRWCKAIYGEENYPPRKCFQKVYGEIDRYLSEPNRNFVEDFTKYLLWNVKHYTPRIVVSDAFTVRKFFSRHGHEIDTNDWDDLASLMPANVAVTQDQIPTKEQLQAILNHLYIGNKAIALFLISTGARIGETMQLKIDDFHLDADPPSADFRAEYTKGGVGMRTVWMSYEARDIIKQWIQLKDTLPQRGVPIQVKDKTRVFPNREEAFQIGWINALNKSQLNERDVRTKIYKFHIHTMRKFFSTNMSDAGVPRDIYEAWMGHKGYLDASYKRYGKKQLAEWYMKYMHVVTVFGNVGATDEFRKKLEASDQERAKAQEDARLKTTELAKVDEVLTKLGISNHRPLEERLLEYYRKTQEQIETNKPKEHTHTQIENNQIPQTPIKPKEIPEIPKHFSIETRACPSQGCYVPINAECNQKCRVSRPKEYVECYKARARIQAGILNDSDHALYKFAGIPGTNTYQLEKSQIA